MGLGDHVNLQLKRGVKIITCDPQKRLIEAETRNGEVITVNAYNYTPSFRWPKPGEKWMVGEENGSWYLEGIYETQQSAYEEFQCGDKYAAQTIIKYQELHYISEVEIEPSLGCFAPNEQGKDEIVELKSSSKEIKGSGIEHILPYLSVGASVKGPGISEGTYITEVKVKSIKISEFPTSSKNSFVTFRKSRWKLFRLPQVEGGDAVISASSGRILQNQEGEITEVPSGLKQPFISEIEKTASVAEMVERINALIKVVEDYKMTETQRETEETSKAIFHSIDDIHGPTTSTDFAARCNVKSKLPNVHADITERSHAGGYTIVEAKWMEGENKVADARLHLYPDVVHFDKLFVHPEFRAGDFYDTLIEKEIIRSFGVKMSKANPKDKVAEHVLSLIGYHWQKFQGEMVFGMRLDQPDRRDEYRQWIKEGSPPTSEPQWRMALKLLPPNEG